LKILEKNNKRSIKFDIMNTKKITERKDLVTFKKAPLTLLGQELNVNDKAPDFQAVDNNLIPVKLSDFKGKVVLLSVTPSVDTPVCDLQGKRFNKMAAEISKDVVILNISMDLPFALSRWCGATGSKQLRTLSDYQERDFGIKYGVLIKELKLLARSVWLIDRDGSVKYKEIVPETTDEPDYDKVFEALKRIVS
jgi:thiol peroxidase